MCEHKNVTLQVDDNDGYTDAWCEDCGQTMMRIREENGYSFIPAHQCEWCDGIFTTNPIPYPDQNSKFKNRSFCCDECAEDAHQDALIWEIEDKRQFEMYGDDYDSWYR